MKRLAVALLITLLRILLTAALAAEAQPAGPVWVE